MKWYIDYIDKSGDLCHVWVRANSADDAEFVAYHEYWDIKDILDVRKAS